MIPPLLLPVNVLFFILAYWLATSLELEGSHRHEILNIRLSVELYCADVSEGQQQNKNFDMLENYGNICMTQKSYLLMVPSVTVYYSGNLHVDRLNVNE
jgi:thioredoxin-related protein